MRRVITKKAYTNAFGLVESEQKAFDLRVADFEFEQGDILELIEVDDDKKPTGRTLRKQIDASLRTKDTREWFSEDDVERYGYVVMSLRDEKPEKNRQIVDENDVVLGAKLDHTVDFVVDIYRVATLWLRNTNGDILIARRSPKKKNGGGLWGPSVAGTVENTETYRDNIIKETMEEIGLSGVELAVGPKLYFNTPRRHFAQSFFAVSDKEASEFTLEDEVAAVKWVAPAELAGDAAEHPERYVPHMNEILKEILA